MLHWQAMRFLGKFGIAQSHQHPERMFAIGIDEVFFHLRVSRGIRDDGTEGVQVDIMLGHRQPETSQHATRIDPVIVLFEEWSRQPRDIACSGHGPDVLCLRQLVNARQTK